MGDDTGSAIAMDDDMIRDQAKEGRWLARSTPHPYSGSATDARRTSWSPTAAA